MTMTALHRALAAGDAGQVTGDQDRPDPEVPERARRRTFTAQYKQQVLAAYEAVTELSASDGSLVRAVSGVGYGLYIPAGIAVDGADVWVANGDGNSVTELKSPRATMVLSLNGATSPLRRDPGRGERRVDRTADAGRWRIVRLTSHPGM